MAPAMGGLGPHDAPGFPVGPLDKEPKPQSLDDGGSAFPHSHEKLDHPKWSVSSGMTLRDWFAGMALQPYLAKIPPAATYDDVAERAYRVADAMLKARRHRRVKGGER